MPGGAGHRPPGCHALRRKYTFAVNDEQRPAICRVLLAHLGLGHLWENDHLTEEAQELMSDPHGPISEEDRRLLRIIADLGGGGDLNGLLRLEADYRELVGTLITASSKGEIAVQQWIRQNLPTHEQQ